MPLAEKDFSRCEQCGAPFDNVTSVYGCLNCLLLGGPDQNLKPFEENRRFQHYELSLLADGRTLWELGRDAMASLTPLDVPFNSAQAVKVIIPRASTPNRLLPPPRQRQLPLSRPVQPRHLLPLRERHRDRARVRTLARLRRGDSKIHYRGVKQGGDSAMHCPSPTKARHRTSPSD